jgi:hypothetical protein
MLAACGQCGEGAERACGQCGTPACSPLCHDGHLAERSGCLTQKCREAKKAKEVQDAADATAEKRRGSAEFNKKYYAEEKARKVRDEATELARDEAERSWRAEVEGVLDAGLLVRASTFFPREIYMSGLYLFPDGDSRIVTPPQGRLRVGYYIFPPALATEDRQAYALYVEDGPAKNFLRTVTRDDQGSHTAKTDGAFSNGVQQYKYGPRYTNGVFYLGEVPAGG